MAHSALKFLAASGVAASALLGVSARADIISDTTINSRQKVVAAYGSFDDFWSSLTAYLSSSTSAYGLLYSDFGGKSLVTVIGLYNSWATQVTFDASTLTVSAKGLTWSGPITTGPTGNTVVNTGSVTAPGPIAGAGIPAVLGLLGYAAWRRRQQSAA